MESNIAMYRRYRGTDFNQIYGQDHVIKPLAAAIKAGNVSHAYLLTGPRGVGKTSIARIIAHKINDIPYKLGELPIDIVEIDAASNRRIDEVRDLREKVHIAPVSAKFKVYIIDEVHMLTREAFNALLKTLEEPPRHIVFILATTEIHKLPPTIVSRTQRFSFKPITDDVIVKQLANIAKKEELEIDDEALELLARHGDGSLRDSISLLDQLSHQKSGKRITVENVQNMLGLPAEQQVIDLYRSVSSGDTAKVMTQLHDFHVAGYNAVTIAEQTIQHIRQRQRYESTVSEANVHLVDNLLSVAASRSPELQLEVTMLKAALQNKGEGATKQSKKLDDKQAPSATLNKQAVPTPEQAVSEKSPSAKAAPKPSAHGADFSQAIWSKILTDVKKQNNALYAVLRMSELKITDEKAILRFKYPFHQRRATEAKNKKLLMDVLHEHVGEYELDMIVETEVLASNETVDHAAAIISTFGGGEVVDV